MERSMNKSKHFKNIGKRKLEKLLKELEIYNEIYISDKVSNLYIRVFIEKQRNKNNAA